MQSNNNIGPQCINQHYVDIGEGNGQFNQALLKLQNILINDACLMDSNRPQYAIRLSSAHHNNVDEIIIKKQPTHNNVLSLLHQPSITRPQLSEVNAQCSSMFTTYCLPSSHLIKTTLPLLESSEGHPSCHTSDFQLMNNSNCNNTPGIHYIISSYQYRRTIHPHMRDLRPPATARSGRDTSETASAPMSAAHPIPNRCPTSAGPRASR